MELNKSQFKQWLESLPEDKVIGVFDKYDLYVHPFSIYLQLLHGFVFGKWIIGGNYYYYADNGLISNKGYLTGWAFDFAREIQVFQNNEPYIIVTPKRALDVLNIVND